MFSFFNKSNFTIQIFIIIICGIALWLPGLLNPTEIHLSSSLTPLYNQLVDIIGFSNILSFIIGLLCLFLVAFLFNNVLSANDIIPRNNYLPAFFVVLLGSWHNQLLTFHNALPAALCLVFAISNVFKVATYEDSFNNAFLTGFYIALASLFYFPSIIFFALIPVGLIVIKVFKLRFWLLSFSGFLFVYLCLAVWKFCYDILVLSAYDYINYFENLSLINLHLNNILLFYILGIPFILLMLISFLKIIATLIEQNISVRQALLFIIWFSVFASVGFFIDSKDFIIHSVLLILPVSLFFIKYLIDIKKRLNVEIAFTIIIIFIVFFRFYV